MSYTAWWKDTAEQNLDIWSILIKLSMPALRFMPMASQRTGGPSLLLHDMTLPRPVPFPSSCRNSPATHPLGIQLVLIRLPMAAQTLRNDWDLSITPIWVVQRCFMQLLREDGYIHFVLHDQTGQCGARGVHHAISVCSVQQVHELDFIRHVFSTFVRADSGK